MSEKLNHSNITDYTICGNSMLFLHTRTRTHTILKVYRIYKMPVVLMSIRYNLLYKPKNHNKK